MTRNYHKKARSDRTAIDFRHQSARITAVMVAGTMTASKINATINTSCRTVAATSHASLGLQECVNTLSVSELGKPRQVNATCRGLFFHGFLEA